MTQRRGRFAMPHHADELTVDAMVALNGLLDTAPAISWRGELQAVPLHRARVVFGGRRGMAVHAYKADVDEVYRQDLRMMWGAAGLRGPLIGSLALVLTFAGRRPRNGRRPDVTNLVKAVEDAGNPSRDGGWPGLWNDDGQIELELVHLRRWDKHTRPLVSMDIWRLA